ncbi:class I SAM-dependent methyltransferase [Magnetococcus sp. PR-3]|uniref:class I SAM-dependent methyltransferase n=1 Tax=Magnetococcus sp. PR-3 TaxID=3120355 RepID=UPI002FCE18E1
MLRQQCRVCGADLNHTMIDLGNMPPANDLLEKVDQAEQDYPLKVMVCQHCLMAQSVYEPPADSLFRNDYVYFSSYSDSWVAHAKTYAEQIIAQQGLTPDHQVVEVASNDGYLLRHFKEAGIKVLGVEPCDSVANAAEELGIPCRRDFFGLSLAQTLQQAGYGADLLVGNNVLAHVPDINDFVSGLAHLLNPDGLLTMEFPHLLNLMQQVQFDTIYHEHYAYLSLAAVEYLFATHGLTLFHVEELSTHGGSLRVFAKKRQTRIKPEPSVHKLLSKERQAGLFDPEWYATLGEKATQAKESLIRFLAMAHAQGKSVVGYGAAAKGNTLLNYCGIYGVHLSYVVDRNPHKQNRWLPGSRIPVKDPEEIRRTKPDYLLILPWNLKDEIMQQMRYIEEWGGEFVIPIPHTQVVSPNHEL